MDRYLCECIGQQFKQNRNAGYYYVWKAKDKELRFNAS